MTSRTITNLQTMQILDVNHNDGKNSSLTFKYSTKMIPQYQLEDGDAYIIYFKNGASLFISKDSDEYWYYQPDENMDINDGIKILPQPDIYEELVTFIKNNSNYNNTEDCWDIVK